MKKYILIVLLFILSAFTFSISAQNDTNAVYLETYLCSDAYTIKIGAQPQMMSQITETIFDYLQLSPPPNPEYLETQYLVELGKQTEEDVLLQFRIILRNLNPVTVCGLKPNSFILSGKVRDREFQYIPEVFVPYDYYDWGLNISRANLNSRIIRYPYIEKKFYKMANIMDPQIMKEKEIASMRVQEMRLIYRVPSWLSGWDLHIQPQPMIDDPNLKSCDMILHLPTISNEITRETYKYID